MQETKEKESDQNVTRKETGSFTYETQSQRESRASWSGLWLRYKKLWRVRRRTGDLKETGIKFALLTGFLLLISPVYSGLIIASFAGVFLVAYESYKQNIDPFVSSHIGAVAGIPAVLLSLGLILTSPGLAEAMAGSIIAVMYSITYPILYFVYSSIGENFSENVAEF